MFAYYFAGTVYDYYFHKDGQGQWNVWTDSITNEENVIPPGAIVSVFMSKRSLLLKVPLWGSKFADTLSSPGVRPHHPNHGDGTSAFFPAHLPGT